MNDVCLLRKVIKKITLIFLIFSILFAVTACGEEKSDIHYIEKEVEKTNQYFVKGDYHKCIKKYKKLLKEIKKGGNDNPKDIVLLDCRLGLCYITIADYDIAEQYLIEAKQISEKIDLKELPVDSVYYTYGQLETMRNNHEQAVEYFNEALNWRKIIYGEEAQETGGPYIELAFSYIQLGKLDDAEKCAQTVLSLKYDDAHNYMYKTNAYLALGDIYMERKNYKKALVTYGDAEQSYINEGKPLGESMIKMLEEKESIVLNKIYENGN